MVSASFNAANAHTASFFVTGMKIGNNLDSLSISIVTAATRQYLCPSADASKAARSQCIILAWRSEGNGSIHCLDSLWAYGSQVKAQAKSLDDRGSVGYLLDIDVWQSGATRIMQDGIVVKGLAPKLLGPSRYHLNPRTDLTELEKGMPWRTIKDEFGKFKWIDHEGRAYQGNPYSVEPDATTKQIFVASMMHASMRSPTLSDTPDVTCPSEFPDSECRKEVVHHENS